MFGKLLFALITVFFYGQVQKLFALKQKKQIFRWLLQPPWLVKLSLLCLENFFLFWGQIVVSYFLRPCIYKINIIFLNIFPFLLLFVFFIVSTGKHKPKKSLRNKLLQRKKSMLKRKKSKKFGVSLWGVVAIFLSLIFLIPFLKEGCFLFFPFFFFGNFLFLWEFFFFFVFQVVVVVVGFRSLAQKKNLILKNIFFYFQVVVVWASRSHTLSIKQQMPSLKFFFFLFSSVYV